MIEKGNGKKLVVCIKYSVHILLFHVNINHNMDLYENLINKNSLLSHGTIVVLNPFMVPSCIVFRNIMSNIRPIT